MTSYWPNILTLTQIVAVIGILMFMGGLLSSFYYSLGKKTLTVEDGVNRLQKNYRFVLLGCVIVCFCKVVTAISLFDIYREMTPKIEQHLLSVAILTFASWVIVSLFYRGSSVVIKGNESICIGISPRPDNSLVWLHLNPLKNGKMEDRIKSLSEVLRITYETTKKPVELTSWLWVSRYKKGSAKYLAVSEELGGKLTVGKTITYRGLENLLLKFKSPSIEGPFKEVEMYWTPE